MIKKNEKIRNVAIIAHVDHGKTTLVDALFKQSGLNNLSQERVMDSMALERERGITISAKNCAIHYKGVKINIIDTPGHSDFGGEVERALSMVDSVILLCDSAEGPLPQTRFVLQKALNKKLKLIIVINKIDRQDARPKEVLNEVYDLLLELSDDESYLDSPVFYANGRDGICSSKLENESVKDLHELLDAIIGKMPAPEFDSDEPFQMLVSDLSYSEYLGRLAIGKVINGKASVNDSLICINEKNNNISLRVTRLQIYDGPSLKEVSEVESGDIIVLSGVNDVFIGDTICTSKQIKALPRINVDEPTVSMLFSKNISPLSGTEGKILTSNRIWEYLKKEALKNVSIQIEKNTDDTFTVKGRGEFQMAIIVEQMRREGFELCIGRPKVIFKKDNEGHVLEPVENVYADCPQEYSGTVMETLSNRKAILINLVYNDNGRVKLQFHVPSRGLIGYRDLFLTETHGYGILNSSLIGYEEYKGDFLERNTGSLICDRSGEAVAYGIWELEDRGKFFIEPGDPVYEGQIVGERNKEGDLILNPTRTKKLTNLRASGHDEAVTLTPIKKMTLDRAISFIKDDELVEVTPTSIRLCKKILNNQKRHILENRGYIPEFL